MGVQLNIKSAEARELAEEIAETTGVSLTTAVVEALRERQRQISYDKRYAEVMAIIKGSRALWKPEFLEANLDDWLYDEDGLPR